MFPVQTFPTINKFVLYCIVKSPKRKTKDCCRKWGLPVIPSRLTCIMPLILAYPRQQQTVLASCPSLSQTKADVETSCHSLTQTTADPAKFFNLFKIPQYITNLYGKLSQIIPAFGTMCSYLRLSAAISWEILESAVVWDKLGHLAKTVCCCLR